MNQFQSPTDYHLKMIFIWQQFESANRIDNIVKVIDVSPRFPRPLKKVEKKDE